MVLYITITLILYDIKTKWRFLVRADIQAHLMNRRYHFDQIAASVADNVLCLHPFLHWNKDYLLTKL